MQKLNTVLLIILLTGFFSCSQESNEIEQVNPGWPDVSYETKPWTRWWWMGSNVNKEDLSAAIKEYSEAGLGGLELTPIYGVKGQEADFINFTSDKWMDNLVHTLNAAKDANMGIDMALASGWPFGGPWVTPSDACKFLQLKSYKVTKGESLTETVEFSQKPILRIVGKKVDITEIKDPIATNDSLQLYAFDQVRFPRSLPLITLIGFSDNGEIIDLTDKVDSTGTLNWNAGDNSWTLCAAFSAWHGKMVERAGPGGEGDVLDHFSKQATENYLAHFDKSFEGKDISYLRAFFNDSYEVDDAIGEANFTPGFFDFFKQKRGYDLKDHLLALMPSSDTTNGAYKKRILCDYRETISELLLENFTQPWEKWAKDKGKIIRNQSHGSPANILDLYAASDIPETEGTKILNIKAASSAAHVSGKNLVSAEAATWLNEHFTGTLSQTKENVDRYFVGGVNHIVYHGTTFSPKNENWPGRMFYASVHFAPSNTIWKDFPALNNYVTKVQSFLQRAVADNDILLYYPIYDEWMKPGKESILHFHGVEEDSPVYELAKTLQDTGFTFDYISDKQISMLDVEKMMLKSGKKIYKTILVPPVEYIPLSTMTKLQNLAEKGATILFYKELPKNASGWNKNEENQKALDQEKQAFNFNQTEKLKIASVNKGKIILSDDLLQMLKKANIEREILTDSGLEFLRLTDMNTKTYFISNWSGYKVDKQVELSSDFVTALIYNPMTGVFGKAKTENKNISLQLKQGESCIIQLWDKEVDVENFKYYKNTGEPILLSTGWNIQFIEGGPATPKTYKEINLGSWTDLPDNESKYFSGTATYTIQFETPDTTVKYWKLNLGDVFVSADVTLNGKNLATLIGPDYSIEFSSEILAIENNLKISVTNLMANRIIYMDKNNIPYRNFYNTNFNASLRENLGEDRKFTSKNWSPLKSGLVGPVELIPLAKK